MEALSLDETSTSRFVQTKKWKLHYNEAGSGHPVIMLHGTGPGATGWSNFRQNFTELSKHYRVILLDFPGWGQSDTMDPAVEPRSRANPESVKLLMDELGLDRAALVGNSMGGAAALQFAAMFPERMSHLITMGAGFAGTPNILTTGGMSEGIQIIRETYEEPSPENFRRLVKIMVFDSSFVTDQLLSERSRAALANTTHLKNWLAGLQSGGGMPPLGGDLPLKLSQLKAPALLIHGRDDRVVSMENSLKLVSTIPNSRLVIFNRCGHWAQVEHAREFNVLVHGFLQMNPD